MKSFLYTIFCCICDDYISPTVITGKEIYPHRPDLFDLRFFKCSKCGGYVGTHKDTGKPLGCIVSREVKNARIRIHRVLDSLWKNGRMKRKEVYKKISDYIGKEYHTGDIRTKAEARKISEFLSRMSRED